MSFILDALKKSESDRQRQTGPALFEVKVAPPKARFPVWAVAIVALLVINMMIVGWLLLRRSSRGDENGRWLTTSTTAPAASASQPRQRYVPNGPSTNGSTGSPPAGHAASSQTQPNPSRQTGPSDEWRVLGLRAANDLQPVKRASESPRHVRAPPTRQSMPDGAPQPGQPAHLPDRDQNEPTLAGTARRLRC